MRPQHWRIILDRFLLKYIEVSLTNSIQYLCDFGRRPNSTLLASRFPLGREEVEVDPRLELVVTSLATSLAIVVTTTEVAAIEVVGIEEKTEVIGSEVTEVVAAVVAAVAAVVAVVTELVAAVVVEVAVVSGRASGHKISKLEKLCHG